VINIAYGYVQRKQSSLVRPAEVFHTRQLSYPVLITVYQMLDCRAMDIIAFSPESLKLALPDGKSERVDGLRTSWRSLLQDASEVGWCLFTVDVRNTYGLPFEVVFERKKEGMLNLR
jgi:trafficking protein particle complex subunit 9